MLLKILRAIVQIFRKPHAITHLNFRKGEIKATAMELYKGYSIFYLTKPQRDPAKDPLSTQPIYHVFAKNTIYFGEADTQEELELLAKKDIDEGFANATPML